MRNEELGMLLLFVRNKIEVNYEENSGHRDTGGACQVWWV